MCNTSLAENATDLRWRNPAYSAVFGSVMTLGLPLNAVSLWILLRRHKIHSPSAVFMVNLAISDLLLVVSLPLRVYFYATGSWPLGDMTCIWTTMLFHNNIRSSSIFITFICVDRLLAVVYPLRTRHIRTTSNAYKAVAVVWVFVVVWNFPEGWFFSVFLNSCPACKCFEFPCTYQLVLDPLQPALVLLMLIVNIVCTIMVSATLRRQVSESAKVNNKVNVMLIFIMNLIMFAVFFLPVSLAALFQRWASRTALLCLASVNCCLDPLLYYFSFDGFWKRKEDVDSSTPCG